MCVHACVCGCVCCARCMHNECGSARPEIACGKWHETCLETCRASSKLQRQHGSMHECNNCSKPVARAARMGASFAASLLLVQHAWVQVLQRTCCSCSLHGCMGCIELVASCIMHGCMCCSEPVARARDASSSRRPNSWRHVTFSSLAPTTTVWPVVVSLIDSTCVIGTPLQGEHAELLL